MTDRTMGTLEANLADWHRRKFGTSKVDLHRTMVKLTEEVGELAKAILKKDNQNAKEECADVLITLAHIARELGTNLLGIAWDKYEVIEERLRTGVKK